METKLIKALVVLGVPGVALGFYFLLLKTFHFEFSPINSNWSALIAILFLIIIAGITFYALCQWTPAQSVDSTKEADSSNKQNKEKKENFVFQVGEEKITYEEKMTSLNMDVVKIYAHTHLLGVAAEYHWIENKYSGATTLSQSLSTLNLLTKEKTDKEIHFDIIKIQLLHGRTKKIFFDISDFFDGNGHSLLDEDCFVTNKLKKLYN